MNSFERYTAMVSGGTADLVPRVPILMAFAADYIGANYAEFASDHRVLVEANLRCAADFGFDQLSAISDPYRETQGFGAEIEYVTDGVPRCKKPPLEDTEDLSILKKPNPYTSERMLDRVNAIRLYKEKAFQQYSIMGWVEGPAAEASDLRGLMNFLVDILDEEEYTAELMDRCTDVAIEFALAQVEAGADTIGIGDAICSQISPDTYTELVLPRERRLIEAIQAAGARTRLHICGNITHLLPGIATLPVDIVDIDWQVDMGEARRILGKEKSLAGNLDPVNVIQRKTPEEIRKGFRDIYGAVGNRYLVNAGCEIPLGTPVANLKAMCEVGEWGMGYGE